MNNLERLHAAPVVEGPPAFDLPSGPLLVTWLHSLNDPALGPVRWTTRHRIQGAQVKLLDSLVRFGKGPRASLVRVESDLANWRCTCAQDRWARLVTLDPALRCAHLRYLLKMSRAAGGHS